MAEKPPSDETQLPENPPSEAQRTEQSPQQGPGFVEVNVCPNCGWANSLYRVTCKQCRTTLPVLEKPVRPPLPVLSRTAKWFHITAGFIGWFLLNGVTWLALNIEPSISNQESGFSIMNGLCVLPVNGLVLILLALNLGTRWIALGILAAWAFNLFISLFVGTINNGVCMVPFFIK